MTSSGVRALSLLVGAGGEFPRPRWKTYSQKQKEAMSQQQDPLLALVLSKLNAIEKSIDKLATHVAKQNGRIGKLEEKNAEELAVSEHIEKELEVIAANKERRFRRVTVTVSGVAALFGGTVGVILERVL